MCPLCNQWSVVMCPAQELAPIHQLFHLILSRNLIQDLSLLHAPEVSPLSQLLAPDKSAPLVTQDGPPLPT